MIRTVVGVATVPSAPTRTPSRFHPIPWYSPGPLAVTVVVVTLLAACGAGSHRAGSPAGAPAAPGKPHPPLLVAGRAGTATVALDAVPLTLNDHTVAGNTDATRLVASAVWVQVFQVGPQMKPTLDTDVVQSAEVVSVNPQTVVYQIAPKATWSDGVPITAADFKYAWQSQRGGATDIDGRPDSVASTLGYRDIVSVASADKGRTVTVTFHTPYADWESLFDDLLPAHIAEQVGWNDGFDRFDPSTLVSGGAWLIKAWVPGQEIVLGHNPTWWGPVPRFTRIILEAVTSPAVLVRGLATHRFQVAAPSTFDASLISQLSARPDIETETQSGATVLQLDFNVRHFPLDSVSVRQGIAHTIDRTGIADSVTQPLEHDAGPDNSHLFANLQPAYTDGATGYETADPVIAATVLAQGGLVADADGTWTLHGTPVTLGLTWADDDPWSAAVGPLIAGQLVAAGFDVATAPVAGSQLLGTVLQAGQFDLALVPERATAYPSQLAAVFSADTTSSISPSQNWTGFDDPRIDALFTQAQEELSANQAAARYNEIDQDLWLEMPTLPLLAEPDFVAISASVSGVQDDPGGLGALWGINGWAPLVAARHAKAPAG